MKKTVLLLTLSLLPTIAIATPSLAAVYLKYSNGDSEKHVLKVKMDGQTKEVIFEGRTTGAATIQGSGKVATIETRCGNVEVKDDTKIEIKNGCIKVL